MDTRICTHCHIEKPATLEFFYGHHTNKGHLESWCKDCKKERSKNTPDKVKRDKAPRDIGEALALSAFRNQGIPAELGKNIRTTKWVDIVLWGCIKVEVKYSQKATAWQWAFYSTLNEKTAMPDVFMLIGKHSETQRNHYFILPVNHPMFFNPNNNRKKAVVYSYRNRIGVKGFVIDPLLQHENNYGLIEKLRVQASQSLIELARAA